MRQGRVSRTWTSMLVIAALGAAVAAQDQPQQPGDPLPIEGQEGAPPPDQPEPDVPPLRMGEEPAGAQNRPAEGEMNASLAEAVARGFAYMKSQQQPDGSVGEEGRGRYGHH